MRCRGLDVSSVQGAVNYDDLPSWVRFVVAKASEGTNGIDPQVARNLVEARRTGRVAMVYHFVKTSQGNPVEQAAELLKAIGDDHTLQVWIDFESLANGLAPAEACKTVLDLADDLEKVSFRTPGLYTFPWFEQTVIAPDSADAARFARLPLWLATYDGGETPSETWEPKVPAPWSTWAMVQTSGNNSTLVPGVPGHVDHDLFNGDETALVAFATPARPADSISGPASGC